MKIAKYSIDDIKVGDDIRIGKSYNSKLILSNSYYTSHSWIIKSKKENILTLTYGREQFAIVYIKDIKILEIVRSVSDCLKLNKPKMNNIIKLKTKNNLYEIS